MEFLLLFPLSLMIYQDFKFRNVLLWQLLLFGAVQIGICICKYGLIPAGYNAFINLIILLVVSVFVVVYAYFRYKNKHQFIGGGDVVFILLLTPYFSSRHFLYFLTLSFLLTLVGWMVWGYFQKERSNDIPLVSGVGICYAILLMYNSLSA